MFWVTAIVAIVFGSIIAIFAMLFHYLFKHGRKATSKETRAEIEKLETLNKLGSNLKKRIDNLETVLMDKGRSGESKDK
jgi:phage shock protein B